MIRSLIIVGIVTLLYALASDPVTELPWGLHQPLTVFFNQLSLAYSHFPPLATLMNVIGIAITVKIAVWSFNMYLRIIEIIKG